MIFQGNGSLQETGSRFHVGMIGINTCIIITFHGENEAAIYGYNPPMWYSVK